MEKIYVVTTIYVPRDSWDLDTWTPEFMVEQYPETRTRCVAWYPNEEDAIACVENGGAFLSEDGYYNLAVIEELEPGIYPYPSDEGEKWYAYNEETKAWVLFIKPKFYDRIKGFGIG